MGVPPVLTVLYSMVAVVWFFVFVKYEFKKPPPKSPHIFYETPKNLEFRWYSTNLNGRCYRCGMDDCPLAIRTGDINGKPMTHWACKWCLELEAINIHLGLKPKPLAPGERPFFGVP